MLSELLEEISKIYEEWRELSRLTVRNDLALRVISKYDELEKEVRRFGYVEQFEELPIHIGFAHLFDSNLELATKIKFRAAKAMCEIITEGDTMEIYQGLVMLSQRKNLLRDVEGEFKDRFLGKRRAIRPILRQCYVCGKYKYGGGWTTVIPSGKWEVVKSMCVECSIERQKEVSKFVDKR